MTIPDQEQEIKNEGNEKKHAAFGRPGFCPHSFNAWPASKEF